VRRGNPQLPSLGVHLQLLMSPVLRESLGMVTGKHTGVMVARVDFGASAFGTLRVSSAGGKLQRECKNCPHQLRRSRATHAQTASQLKIL
jgi:hypothetical protein